MGIALPQLAPASTDRVSGAQVITGSLKFDGQSGGDHYFGHLKRTSSGASGGGTFTISWWAKRGSMRDDWQYMIAGTNGSLWGVGFPGSSGTRDSLTLFNGSHQFSSARFRDNSGWYHIVLVVNANSGAKLWVNGEGQSNTNTTTSWNLNNDMYIGKWVDSGTAHNYDGYLAQYTCIDGLELGPSYFAYTDPLTGAWRPKKFVAEGTTVNDGTDWGTATMSGSGTVNNKSNIFDGSESTAGGSTGANTDLTFTLPKSIRVKKSVRIYQNQNGTAKINSEPAVTTSSGGANWVTIFDGETDFTSLTLTSTGGDTCDIRAIEVDGVKLKSNATQNLAFGNAGFYLPLNGNTPIGEDLSGNNNDWTPEGFGGSVALDHPTVSGARPILNTVNGGTSAAPGVFGSKVSSTIAVTVSNATGNNKYYFDTVLNPTLALIRGATITFDTTDSSNNSHPFKLSSTNADSSSGTEYTDGVAYYINGSTVTGSDYVSNYSNNGGGTGFRGIKWTIPHNVSTTYYYCTQHNGMGNNGRLNSTTDETKADPYAWKCVLAMPLVGSNTDVCDKINCTTTAKVLAAKGDATQSSGQSNWYGGSYYFDGSGDYLGATTSADFAMGTGDFTLECWVYKSGSGAFMNFMATRGGPGTSAGFTFGSQSAANGYDVEFYTDGLKLDGGAQGITNGRWHHVAVTRSGTSLRSYVNGVLNTTATNSQNLSNTSLALGITNDATQGPLHGYLQDVRIYKGVAKYSGGSVGDQVFIVPATNSDILPDTPSGVAVKSKLKKITDGAVSIQRSSNDYLQAPASTNFRLDGQYCIEFFLNLTDYSNDSVYVRTFVLDGPTGDGGSTNIHLNVNATNGQLLLWSGSSQQISPNAYTYVGGGWHHVCLTRDSSNRTRLFIDGVLGNWSDITTDYNLNSNQNRPRLGALGNTGGTSGHYSSWRIIKGSIPTEYQTSTSTNGTRVFSPPSAPLTTTSQGATANDVELLSCQSNILSAPVSPLTSGVNSGTVWSDSVVLGSTFRSGFPAIDAFNGVSKSSTNDCAAPDIVQNAFIEFTFGGGVPFTTLQMQCDDNNSGTVVVNGVDITSQLPTGSLTNTTITGITSPLTSLRLTKTTSDASSVYLGSVTIDGTMLRDPLTIAGGATATNFNPFNTNIDKVRGQEGAYATFNPLVLINGGSSVFNDGNFSLRGGSTNGATASTINPTSGKHYLELDIDYVSGQTQGNMGLGVVNEYLYGVGNPSGNSYPSTFCGFFTRTEINSVVNGSETGAQTTEPTVNYTLGLAVDYDAKSMTLYLNGTKGNTVSFSSVTNPLLYFLWGNTNNTMVVNFGQKPFKFPPPDGYQPLTSSTVRPDTVITRPDQYVKANAYRGNGATSPGGSGGTQTINMGFKPDMIWLKDRTQAHNNNIIDSLNGAPNIIIPDSAGTTLITNSTDGLTAFTDNGFTLGDNGAGTQSLELNKGGNNYVAWCWKAGGAPTATNTNTSGAMAANSVSIDGVLQSAYTPSGSPNQYPSKMSIGTKQGFSVVQWEGPSGSNINIPHGLSEIPSFYIIKNVDAGDNYYIYTTNMDGSLDFSANFGTGGYSNSARSFPTTSTVNFTTDSSGTYIMYCWHDVPGLHKSGKYTGNSSSNGPVIDLGFRPAMILLKKNTNTDSNSGWHWYDNKRNTYNPANNFLLAGHAYYENRAANNTADVSSYTVDFLSNGFRLSHSSNNLNYTGNTYFYAAWAEAPAFNLYGAQSSAR